MPPKKSIEVSFGTPGMEKMEKKVEDFLFLPPGYFWTQKNIY